MQICQFLPIIPRKLFSLTFPLPGCPLLQAVAETDKCIFNPGKCAKFCYSEWGRCRSTLTHSPGASLLLFFAVWQSHRLMDATPAEMRTTSTTTNTTAIPTPMAGGPVSHRTQGGFLGRFSRLNIFSKWLHHMHFIRRCALV